MNNTKIKEVEKSQTGRIFSIFVVSSYLLYLSLRKNKTLSPAERFLLISMGLATFITCYYAFIDNHNKIEDATNKYII